MYPQDLLKWKAHSFACFHSTSNQVYASAWDCTEYTWKSGGCKKVPILVILHTIDSNKFQESLNWCHQLAWFSMELQDSSKYQLAVSRLLAKYMVSRKGIVHKVSDIIWNLCPSLSQTSMKYFTLLTSRGCLTFWFEYVGVVFSFTDENSLCFYSALI